MSDSGHKSRVRTAAKRHDNMIEIKDDFFEPRNFGC
jgi:ribosomal protein S20